MPDTTPHLPSWASIRKFLLESPAIRPSVQTPLSPPVDVTGKPEPPPVMPQEESRLPYIPYRGSQDHGVPTPSVFHEDAEGYTGGTVDVHYDDKEPGGTVLDVRVISDAVEQISAWRVTQSVCPVMGSAPAQIVNRNRTRSKVTVQNLSQTDGIWISPDTNTSPLTSYFIAAGTSKDFSTTEEIYGMSGTATAVPVAILWEYKKEA